MNRIIAAAVFLAFLPTANAADKKADFSTNAEFRARYNYNKNAGGNENSMPATENTLSHRFKMGVNYRANEKVSAQVTLLHNAIWGGDQDTNTVTKVNATDSVATTNNDSSDNVLVVNEAYGAWMVSDDLNAKFGRQNFAFGDGSIMSVNDWEAVPYAFDGVSANYEIEAGSIKAFAFKLAELNNGEAAGGDPEHNLYGLSFDLKTMPDMLKGVNLHVIKERRDTSFSTTNNPTTGALVVNDVNGKDFMRYGVNVGGEVAGFDFKAIYEMVTGDYLDQATAGAAVTKVDGKSSMMEASVGYGMEAMMKSHFAFTWHKDSGNDGGSATENGTYSGFFHEQHCSSGCMDLFDYGNLSFMALTAKMSPMDDTTVGLGYYMFKSTESGAGAGGNVAGNNGSRLTGQDVTKDDLGNEIDLWAEHAYDNGVSTMARIGYFTPGDAFDNATTDRGDKVMQLFLQAKMTF